MLSFDERVLNFEHLLNDTDDQIIEYIHENFEKVTNMSVQTLAENVFTVPNTIIRLSRKLGYDGFSHMKTGMREELKSIQESEAIKNIKKTNELLNPKKINLLNSIIYQASRVVIYGVGDSAIYCEYLVNGFRVVNKKCEFYLHRHSAFTELESLTTKDLLILISVSGETEQLLEMARYAATNDVRVAVITHLSKNSLQRYANHSIYFSSPPVYQHHHNITDPTPIFYLLRHILEEYWKTYT